MPERTGTTVPLIPRVDYDAFPRRPLKAGHVLRIYRER
jgi:hypothetical protein